MKFICKEMEMEIVIVSEVTPAQKYKYIFSFICGCKP